MFPTMGMMGRMGAMVTADRDGKWPKEIPHRKKTKETKVLAHGHVAQGQRR